MSARAYPEIGFGDSHHSVAHHHGDPEKIAKTTKINVFHTKMLSYYLDNLKRGFSRCLGCKFGFRDNRYGDD